MRGLHQVVEVLRCGAEVRAGGRGIVEDGRELALVGRGIDPSQRALQARRRLGEHVRPLTQVRPHRSDDVGLLVGDPGQTIGDLAEVPDRAPQLVDGLRVERGLDPVGDRGDVGGDAARLCRELADVRERSPGPLAAARGLRLRQRLTHIRVGGGRVARDEGRSPLPEQRRGGGAVEAIVVIEHLHASRRLHLTRSSHIGRHRAR